MRRTHAAQPATLSHTTLWLLALAVARSAVVSRAEAAAGGTAADDASLAHTSLSPLLGGEVEVSAAGSTAASARSLGAQMSRLARSLGVRKTRKVTPTGDPKFVVAQAFPAAFSAEEADPFLMLDHFGPVPSKGVVADEDAFPVDWHPHRGQSVVTYMRRGVGRHADSLGTRETFASPGMQYCEVGSGIEHAEGGGTPAGEIDEGFQVWINMASADKMNDPVYGTHGPDELPVVPVGEGATARVLAGTVGGARGPYRGKVDIAWADLTLAPGATARLELDASHDNALLYVSTGAGSVNGAAVPAGAVTRLDGADAGARGVEVVAGPDGLAGLFFAGRMLRQPIAWHGPFVMTTQAEIRSTIDEYRAGTFLKKRAAWDYTVAKANPAYAKRR
jgi:quercetin 2,3-dioxygenase